MAKRDYSIPMHQLINEFSLDIAYGPEGFLELPISSDVVNRPALPLTGYFEYFSSDNIQIIGNAEHRYLEDLNGFERLKRFDALFATGIPLLIFTRGLEPFAECMEAAEKHGVTVARTQAKTANFIAALTASLNVSLGPRTTIHGVLVEVYGEGILLLGDSGIGKSETAVELIKRGHRLVADDAVEIKRVSAISLVGSAPEMIRYFLELRGIGIIDVRRIFGMGAVKPTEKIELVINLEKWDPNKAYNRLGDDDSQTTTILDIKIPSIDIPVRTGRNLAVIIEVAAMNHRNKKMGHNAAKELSDKLYASMVAEQESKNKSN
ncbi:MAG: HPr(Ser) kinase/phosphatase [Clostridia bacterium]|nr:HPr(Ser) kinase/phosphatase [Clostridia bacterium]